MLLAITNPRAIAIPPTTNMMTIDIVVADDLALCASCSWRRPAWRAPSASRRCRRRPSCRVGGTLTNAFESASSRFPAASTSNTSESRADVYLGQSALNLPSALARPGADRQRAQVADVLVDGLVLQLAVSQDRVALPSGRRRPRTSACRAGRTTRRCRSPTRVEERIVRRVPSRLHLVEQLALLRHATSPSTSVNAVTKANALSSFARTLLNLITLSLRGPPEDAFTGLPPSHTDHERKKRRRLRGIRRRAPR